MPELPEVHTTAQILNKLIKGRTIVSVWSDLNSEYYKGKENIKDPKYFKFFKREVKNKKVVRVWRRAKNVLIDIEGDKTILIHMKMTGQLLYGKYKRTPRADFGWQAADEKSPLRDPYSRFIHVVFELDNGKHVAFSDMRKFGTIKLITDSQARAKEFAPIGPEPLDDAFKISDFKKALAKKPQGYIKTVLMDPSIVSGIGNIYSDEILFASKVLPDRKVSSLSDSEMRRIFNNTKKILSKGIDFGGDSMSDYRNPYGKKGEFQLHHQVYGRKHEDCLRRECNGKILRKVISGRSAHYCKECQK
jgi:formamidopyrimidine-DNA glycosylase